VGLFYESTELSCRHARDNKSLIAPICLSRSSWSLYCGGGIMNIAAENVIIAA